MGAYCSKSDSIDAIAPSHSPLPTTNDLTTSLSATDLRAYLSACQSDSELRKFDAALLKQTTRVLNTFSDGNEVRSLSLDSLRAVTGCFAEVNQEVVKYVLNSKKDVWKCQELLDLVQHYFEYSDQVLAFFNALNTCLKGAQHRQLIIDLALRYFEEESNVVDDGFEGSNSIRYARTMQELRNFKEEGDPFNEEFITLFQSVQHQQLLMLHKLKAKRQKLVEKMKSIKTYKKVSLVIFAACFVGVIIFSVVAAAIAAPAVVTAIAAAMSAPMGGMGKWMNSLWKKYENQIKAQAEMIEKVEMRTLLTVMELDTIRVLVSRLQLEIEALLTKAEFSLRDDSTVVVVIADVKKKLSGLTKAITELEEHATTYSRDIRQARTVILQGMSRHSENN